MPAAAVATDFGGGRRRVRVSSAQSNSCACPDQVAPMPSQVASPKAFGSLSASFRVKGYAVSAITTGLP